MKTRSIFDQCIILSVIKLSLLPLRLRMSACECIVRLSQSVETETRKYNLCDRIDLDLVYFYARVNRMEISLKLNI